MRKNKYFILVSVLLLVSLVSVLFSVSLTANAQSSVPKPTDLLYINDFANILNQETKDYIFSNSKVLDEKTKAQIVVVTVESMDGVDIDTYALQIGREWNLGDKKKKNGVVILLAKQERKIKVEVGDGLGGALNDGKVGTMIRNYAIPSLKNNDWNSGVKNLYSAVLSETYKEYNIEVPENIKSQVKKNQNVSSLIVQNKLVRYIIFGVIGLIGYLFFRRRGGSNWNNRGGPGGFFIGGGGFGGGFGGGSSGGGFSGGGGGSGFSGGGSSGDF